MKLICYVVSLSLLWVSNGIQARQSSEDYCYGETVGLIAELRSHEYTDLSQREIEIARKIAFKACMRALQNAEDASAGAATTGSAPPQAAGEKSNDKGFFELLIGDEADKDGNRRLDRKGRY